MAVAFAQSMHALAADRGRWSLPGLLLVGALLGGWSAWFVGARVTIYESSQMARLEVDQAGHPVATAVAGRIVTTHLAVGRAVQAGEVLAALDAAAPRLQYEEAGAQMAALTAQRQARQQELRAEQVARQDERQATRVALDEARARHREADVAARAAAEQAAIYVRLDTRGLASRLDLLRTRADADQKQAAAEALRLAISRLESDQRTKDSDRTARLTQFHREVTRLDGDIRTAEATLARLSYMMDQTQVRAPITGTLGEVATLQPGAVVRQGDTLGVVLPAGALRVVAVPQFHDNHVFTGTLAFNVLMGRHWPPQPADLQAAEALCRALELGPLLDRMPAGMWQLVGETGWQLSHGERSRLYMARALLQGAPLLILDESFAALDPETLHRVHQCVLDHAPTLMVIAHP